MSNELRISLAEWLFRMSEEDVPYQARSLAVYAAVFEVKNNSELAALSGLKGRTFDHWKQFLVTHGWIIVSHSMGGRALGIRVRPSIGGRLVVFDDSVDAAVEPYAMPPTARSSGLHCSPELRARVRRAFGYTCQKCGFHCEPGQEVEINGRLVDSSFLTVDRILPGSRGGRYVDDNVTLACRDCNSFRGDRLPASGISLADMEVLQCR